MAKSVAEKMFFETKNQNVRCRKLDIMQLAVLPETKLTEQQKAEEALMKPFQIPDWLKPDCKGIIPISGEVVNRWNQNVYFERPYGNLHKRIFCANSKDGSDRLTAMFTVVDMMCACQNKPTVLDSQKMKEMATVLFKYCPGKLDKPVMVLASSASISLRFVAYGEIIIQMKFAEDDRILADSLTEKCRENWPDLDVRAVTHDRV